MAMNTYSYQSDITLPQLFFQKATERGEKLALREKKFGIWHKTSWNGYKNHVSLIANGLLALGFKRGDVLAIASENKAEWFYCDLACQAIGGVTNGIYTTDSAKQITYLLNDSRASFYIAENDEQLDKILEARKDCPLIKHIIVLDMKGLKAFQDDAVMSLEDLRAKGQIYAANNPNQLEIELKQGKAEDVAILVYTSGTTGAPKGAMITHNNMVFQSQIAHQYIKLRDDAEQVCFLPLCHVAERCNTFLFPISSGTVVNFVESPETFAENLREIQPHVVFAVPRIWEKMYSSVSIALKDATPMQRYFYNKAIKWNENKTPFLSTLGQKLVLDNIRRTLGLSRVDFIASGAAPISPDLLKWFNALGCPILEGYGTTETSGYASNVPVSDYKLGFVGKAIPLTEIKLSAENEILIKGPNIFKGYLNLPDKTAEVIIDGWYHTGDVGKIENGYVKILDRLKDIIITAGGKNITPSEIENQLKFSPFISDAVVIGDKRAYLTCLIMIDLDNVSKFAQDNAIPFTNFASLTKTKEVQDLIEQEVNSVNKQFARVETIKKFHLIEKMLMAEDEELTPTMKLKRRVIEKKYAAEINVMYKN
jgi:long-chain acyl-CoA synthetase